MAASGANSEPSMDEILASIRRIVQEEKEAPATPADAGPMQEDRGAGAGDTESMSSASPLKDRLNAYQDPTPAASPAAAEPAPEEPSTQLAGHDMGLGGMGQRGTGQGGIGHAEIGQGDLPTQAAASEVASGQPTAPHADPKSLRTAIDRDFSDLFSASSTSEGAAGSATKAVDSSNPVGDPLPRDTAPPFGLRTGAEETANEPDQAETRTGAPEASEEQSASAATSPMDFSAIVPARETLFEETSRSTDLPVDRHSQSVPGDGKPEASQSAPTPSAAPTFSEAPFFAAPRPEGSNAPAAEDGDATAGASAQAEPDSAANETRQEPSPAAKAEPARSSLQGLAGLPAGARVIAAMPDKLSAPETAEPKAETEAKSEPEAEAKSEPEAAGGGRPPEAEADGEPLLTRPDPAQVRPGSALESLLASGVGSGLPIASEPAQPESHDAAQDAAAGSDPEPSGGALPAMDVTPFGPSDLEADTDTTADGPAVAPADAPASPAEAEADADANPVTDGQPETASAAPEQTTQEALERTLDETAAELLRPMVREWLDKNMPRIFEKALQIEMAESVKRQLENKDQAGEG